MSWGAYVDSLVANSTGVITKGCIIGQDGSIWTPAGAANVLGINQAEATKIGTTMKKKADPSDFQAGGITIEGTKYMFLRDVDSDGKIITGKKAGLGNLVLASSASAVVIAFIPEEKGDAARGATKTVEDIAKYLEGTGY